jgi:hypothetical protein
LTSSIVTIHTRHVYHAMISTNANTPYRISLVEIIS